MARMRARRRLVAEINIVPYIDVMLVLLVIFMITAPLLNQGVEIDLPQADVAPLPQADEPPLILTVDRDGRYYLNKADQPDAEQSIDEILIRAAALLQQNPQLAVLVRADQGTDYGQVYRAIALLQQAGASKVGLSADPVEGQ